MNEEEIIIKKRKDCFEKEAKLEKEIKLLNEIYNEYEYDKKESIQDNQLIEDMLHKSRYEYQMISLNNDEISLFNDILSEIEYEIKENKKQLKDTKESIEQLNNQLQKFNEEEGLKNGESRL